MAERQRAHIGWQNPRIAKAMGAQLSPRQEALDTDEALPPLPDPVTPDAMCEWIAKVAPNMRCDSEEDVNYRKRLIATASRHQFRKRKILGSKR